jgi:hypothetical protein
MSIVVVYYAWHGLVRELQIYLTAINNWQILLYDLPNFELNRSIW